MRYQTLDRDLKTMAAVSAQTPQAVDKPKLLTPAQMASLASGLGRKNGVRVIFDNHTTASTDGKIIIIPLTSKENSWICRGYLDHELGHVRFSDLDLAPRKPPFERSLWNIIEDVRIEKALGDGYPGMNTNLGALVSELLRTKTGVFELQPNSPPEAVICGYVGLTLRTLYLKQHVLADLALKARDQFLTTFGPELERDLFSIITQIDSVTDTAGVVAMVKQIVALLEQHRDALDKSGSENNADQDNPEQIPDNKDVPDNPNQFQQIPDDQDQPDNHSQSPTIQDNQDAPDTPEQLPDNQDDQDQPEPIPDHPDNPNDSSQPEPIPDDQDSPDNSGKSGDTSDLHDSSEEEQDDQGSSERIYDDPDQHQQGHDDYDQPNDPGQSERSQDSQGPSEIVPDSSNPSTQSEQQGAQGDANPSIHSSPDPADLDDLTADPDTETQAPGQNSQSQAPDASPLGLTQTPTQKAIAQALESQEEISDYGQQLRKLARDNEYALGIDPHAFQMAVPAPKHLLPKYAYAEQPITASSAVVAKLSAELKALLQAQALARNTPSAAGNRIARYRLHRIKTGEAKLFLRNSTVKQVNTAIHLLVDISGSMAGRRLLTTRDVVFALIKTLAHQRGINLAVTLFPGFYPYNTNPSGDPVYPVATLLPHGQKPASKLLWPITARGCTPLAESLRYVLSTMVDLPETRKLVILLSDGDPNHDRTAKLALDEAKSLGIEVAALGIEGLSNTALFPVCEIVDRVEHLPQKAFKLLESLLTPNKE